MRILVALLLAFVLTFTARAAEPWLKAGDVVALVGGEDMVALAEEGWLETLVTWAQPKDRIRFRSLAWEGDTVFEQRRDLNYPALEAQLDKIGATVVICQFGKMESFAGKDGVAAFTEAYEKLLARLNPEGKRRIALVLPPRVIPWEERERLDQKMHEKWVEQLRESGGKIAKGLVIRDVSKDRKEKLSAYIPGQPLLGRLPDFGIRKDRKSVV